MGFQIPDYLQSYLNNAKYRKPFESFVDNSTYYSQINWQWQEYLESVVRPCVAYGYNAVDGGHGQALSTSTGMAILNGATKLISGNKAFFLGNDESCKFISDIWAKKTNFNLFKSRAISFMNAGGTAIIKANKDRFGKNTLSAYRIDRTLFSANESGDITNAVFFVALLTSTSRSETNQQTYWLVEERGYSETGDKFICYKVFSRGGTVNAPTLPSPYQQGTDFKDLPQQVQTELIRKGVTSLNVKRPLNTYDGLGVWLLRRTAINSCVPDAPLGNPLLYGCLDILWSIDVVFSGSIIDVLNGEGKILVPKQFLQDTLNRLQSQYPNTQFNVTTTELKGYNDESFVYVMPSTFDKDKMQPLPVQFEIRADQYKAMLEMYERLVCVRAGFSPTSILPYLTPDNSAKTAREVTAEDNLTRSSIEETHSLILSVLDRALQEICNQEGFSPDISLQLGDYVGNKIEFDNNIRANYAAGLMPKEEAVKQVNNLSISETVEYMDKLKADQEQAQAQELGGGVFNEQDYYGEIQ